MSVVVPVYNMAEFLEQTLNCWTNQTLKEIELIFVNDDSTDNSLQILQDKAKDDSRIKVFSFTENKSAWSARLLGIQNATGKYIMFADADDTVLPETCEELYNEIEESNVEILHFGTDIINVNNLPQARVDAMNRFVLPFNGTLEGEKVFTTCFRDKKYQFSLWNKIYNAELCKNAIKDAKEAFLPKAQDKLLYFMIASQAKSYKGINGKKYYQYYFGRGSTGYNQLTMAQFERYCRMAWIADRMELFLEKKNLWEKYQDVAQKSRNDLLNDCMARFFNEIPEEKKSEAFDLLIEYWKNDEVVGKIAEKYFYQRYEISKQLENAKSIVYNKRKVRTIATYYHSIENGGVQRVLALLAQIWTELGYKVVVITDEPPSKNDYDMPAGTQRIVIPHYLKVKPKDYYSRATALKKIVEDYHVDAVVYHAWVVNLMFWDELAIKTSGAAFIAHCHNIFSLGLLNSWDNYKKVLAPYPIADCVITLSEADKAFWKFYNKNVQVVINPFTEKPGNWKPDERKPDNHNILWCGRLSAEKNPMDTIPIMTEVIKEVPDAVLHILGASPDKSYEKKLRAEISKRNLEDNVILEGFHKDVKWFYFMSKIFLMTSSYEGYSLTLEDAKMAGIPTVMYELPYLTLTEGNRGIIPVPQKDVNASAKAIISLLKDDEMYQKYAHDAHAHIEELFDFDFKKKWSEIFESLEENHASLVSNYEKTMMETLITHHAQGLDNVINQKRLYKTNLDQLIAEEESLKTNLDKLISDKEIQKTKSAKEIQDLRKKLEASVATTQKTPTPTKGKTIKKIAKKIIPKKMQPAVKSFFLHK